MSNQANLTKRLYTSFILVLALLLSLLVFAFYNFNRLIESNRWNNHTYQVLLENQLLRENLIRMETSIRGYIVSKDRVFVGSFNKSKGEFHKHYAQLKNLTRDRPIQQQRLIKLLEAEGVWQERSNKPLLQSAVPNRSHAESIAARESMISMVAILTEMETTEKTLLAKRSAEQLVLQDWTRLTLIAGSVFSVLLAGSLAISAVRSTAVLHSTNKQLRAEVAEREKAENTLRVTVLELQRSNAELEQFAYVASHDLQEPLRAVGSCVQVLQRRYQGQLDERADKFIQHAVDGATRMQTLINDLLVYSRVGTKAVAYADVNCGEIVQGVLVSHRMAIAESEADIHIGALPIVTGDASQLEQVFQNLISNAIKFKGEAKQEIFIDAQQRDSDWVFSVRDNGPGIEPQYFERIFVMFQRLHTRAEYAGTGIGLAICKKIVERHGGTIWVESESGKGTTFFFSLPVQPNVSS
jgi:signal transduction histidine kinase